MRESKIHIINETSVNEWYETLRSIANSNVYDLSKGNIPCELGDKKDYRLTRLLFCHQIFIDGLESDFNLYGHFNKGNECLLLVAAEGKKGVPSSGGELHGSPFEKIYRSANEDRITVCWHDALSLIRECEQWELKSS